MPKSFAKRCCKCDQPVRVEKHEWKWTRERFIPTDKWPDLGKAICGDCRQASLPMVLYPVFVWEVTEEGFRHTLVNAPKN